MLDRVLLLVGPGAQQARSTALGELGITILSTVCAGQIKLTYAKAFELLTHEVESLPNLESALRSLDASRDFDGHRVLAWGPDARPGAHWLSTAPYEAIVLSLPLYASRFARLQAAAHVLTVLGIPSLSLEERVRSMVDQ